jgi:ribosome maturation factor RimP
VPSPANEKADALLAVEQAVGPVLRGFGVELFDLVLRRERSGWVLRVVIERVGSTEPGGGVSVDLCAEISRELSAALDVADPIGHAYSLEVSSPGVERPLRARADYERFEGKKAKLVLAKPLGDGQHVVVGTLAGVDERYVCIDREGGAEPTQVAVAEIKSAHLVFEFGSTSGKQSHKKKKNNTKHKKRAESGR